ncbi:MAG: DUF4145 domain-containing protein [Nocardioides sp.]|uniref:DUF4145 domain-containing protein n=1 Tax=Nocardioides sp. TaxID=35761 RepID=UPI0039E728A6
MDPDHVPALQRPAFHCPFCGVFSAQQWRPVTATQTSFNGGSSRVQQENFFVANCRACGQSSFWHADQMVFPLQRQGEEPHEDMPTDVRDVYEEARAVASISRKSAAGLLRLALQMLVDVLEPGGGNINDKIGALVTRGLAPEVQQAMDVLRVVGNESVHPGRIDLEADDDLLPALFNLVNVIVEQVVSRPKNIGGLFAKLPAEKLAQIERRDGPAGS